MLGVLALLLALVWTIADSRKNRGVEMEPCEFEGHQYVLYANTCDSWEEAKKFCEEQGGYLAVISSQEENDALYAYMLSCDYENAYFGYSDSRLEGDWEWVEGENSVYENWCAGEPNNEMTNENYAMFYWKYTDGQWNDGNFGRGTQSDSRVFLCEFDGAEASEKQSWLPWILAGFGGFLVIGVFLSLKQRSRKNSRYARNYDIRSGR